MGRKLSGCAKTPNAISPSGSGFPSRFTVPFTSAVGGGVFLVSAQPLAPRIKNNTTNKMRGGIDNLLGGYQWLEIEGKCCRDTQGQGSACASSWRRQQDRS